MSYASTHEYAKIVRLTKSDYNRGIQTTLTLPSYVELTNPENYINFYCGLGNYECGISIRAGEPGWHWFVNGPEGPDGGIFGEFHNGDVINIKLTLDDKTNQMVFLVNGDEKARSHRTYVNQDNARVVLASCTHTYNDDTDPVPSYMPPWDVYHYQVVASNLQYKDANENWHYITSLSQLVDTSSTPRIDHWPEGVPCPNPQDYTVDFSQIGSSRVYASIKH
jgi:hypothetical protein